MRVIHSTLAPKQKATVQVVLAVTTSVTRICALIALTFAAVTGIVSLCFEVVRERSMQSAILSTQADLTVARPLRLERRVMA